MSEVDSRQVLWANVEALMTQRWGGPNLNRLARESKIGPATVVRMKQTATSVGIEVIDKVAATFELAAWQLLVPHMNPASPPTLAPMSASERMFYERVLSAAKSLQEPK